MFENSDCAYRVIPPVPKFEWFDWLDEVKQAKPITQRCAYYFPHFLIESELTYDE
jgi:hypothetical protein